MKLQRSQIEEIATGAVRITEENGAIRLYRFTKEQEELYETSRTFFYSRTFSTAGIRLSFRTDSQDLFLKVRATESTSRSFFSMDVFVNGTAVGYIDNFSDMELEPDYTKGTYPLGLFSKHFLLGEGEKTVCIHLPYTVTFDIEEMILNDGAYIQGIKPEKKLLAFGDSITHGYDALRPSNRYIAKVADMLGAEEYNKGIGGETFCPELAKLSDDFVPDYITVAYGTNDWSGKDRATFMEHCRGFYQALSENYPQTDIFAITPIWRKDMTEDHVFGPFEDVEKCIREATADIRNVRVISGMDFVPKEERFFADFRLHPNDEGFSYYAEKLYHKIKENN